MHLLVFLMESSIQISLQIHDVMYKLMGTRNLLYLSKYIYFFIRNAASITIL